MWILTLAVAGMLAATRAQAGAQAEAGSQPPSFLFLLGDDIG